MKTRAQKIKMVEEGVEVLGRNETLIFADFGGVKTEELKKLRRGLREIDATFKVVKKRLLRIMFEKLGIDFNPEQFESQLGTVISSKNISEIAGQVFKFSKETLGADKKERFQILGGFDLTQRRFLPAAEVKMIGQLPPREVLLGQLMGAVSGPLRAFLYVMSEKSKAKATNN